MSLIDTKEDHMGQLNLYKVDDTKTEGFLEDLESKYDTSDEIKITKVINSENYIYTLSLYTYSEQEENPVEWQWLLDVFGEEDRTTRSNPKSVLVIQIGDKMYACTFGFSFFTVDKYCDTDFAFNFARKNRYKEIKTTALTAPTSKRNKTVNTYIDYSELEFSSGEAFSKIKGKLDILKDFHLFEPNIELGHSIKFNLKSDNLDNIIETILFVENMLNNQSDIYKIPVFSKITDKDTLERLNATLIKCATEDELNISFSEFDIIGTTEIFNHTDYKFTLKRGKNETDLELVTFQDFKSFAEENDLDLATAFEKIKIISHYASNPVKTDKLINLIDYVDDEERCVLSKGKWYHFNDDYLEYLKDSLSEISVSYNPVFDFNKLLHDSFIDEQYPIFKNEEDYCALSEVKAKEKLKKKFYAERAFNLIRENDNGFKNYDRIEQRYGTANIELMDLYKDQTMFAVKIGKSSAHLCYVVDQSLSSLKMYQHKTLEHMPKIDTVCIWIILERASKLPILSNGMPDINSLDMLLLKNKIDGWKKEVRLAGFKPLININYRN